MTKKLVIGTGNEIAEVEQIEILGGDIKSIIHNAKQNMGIELIRMKYEVGQAIVNAPLFKKFAKTQGKFYEQVSEWAGMKPKLLADCVKFYETYPDEDATKLTGKLFVQLKNWRNIRAEIYGDVHDSFMNETSKKSCKHCLIHCRKK